MSENAQLPRSRTGLFGGLCLGCLIGLMCGGLIGGAGIWGFLALVDTVTADPLFDMELPEGRLSTAETKPYVDRLAADYLAAGNVGLVIGLIDGESTEVYGYGERRVGEGTTPDGDTLFEIASVGKTLTGLLLSEMTIRGEVTWDDSAKMFLPDSATVPSYEGHEITLEHLVTHSSGLPSLPPNFELGDPLNPYRDYTPEQMYAGLGQIELSSRPGAKYEYSNLGFGVLGDALARKSGRSYEEVIVERICEPLGLVSTRMTLTDELKSRLAQPHDGGQAVPVWEDTTMPGAGSFLSTGNDMLRFLQAHLDAAQGGNGALAEALRMAILKRRPGDSINRSLGAAWHIDSENALDIVWHNGGAGGSSAYVAFTVNPPRGVVVLSNSSQPVDDLGLKLLYLATWK